MVQPPSRAQARQLLTEALLGVYAEARECQQVARLLLSHVLRVPQHALALDPVVELTPLEWTSLQHALQRLLAHEPLQYVLGEAPFRNLMLAVGPGCLIPRPETEELVQWLLDDLPPGSKARILDVGTGSGCIALSIQQERPHAQVTGWDVSPDALQWAVRNGSQLNLPVQFSLQDIAQTTDLAGWDIVISNPPYVAVEEGPLLESKVKDYEPHLALFAPAANALFFYKEILNKLQSGQTTYLELHSSTAHELTQWILDTLPKAIFELRDDLQGRPRMLKVSV
jgi:release factor glutamine methyltransferase